MSKKHATRASDPVTAYAKQVVSGKVVTGKLVRLACERHLRDLKTAKKRGLYFDLDEAMAAIDLWKLCPHVKGRGFAGTNIAPEPWQEFIIGSVYGWKSIETGLRRFRVVWCEMGRKNGKSTIAYPAMIHGLVLDDEPGAEVYSLATKKDQAKIVYNLARRAAIKVPEFADVINPYRDKLYIEDTDSKAEALGHDADTTDGLNPSVVICDEIHKWKSRELWDVIDTATGARAQPLIWVITTAGRAGADDIYGQEHEYTRQVIEGTIEDDSRFGYIACLDPEDDWTDERNFIKANPNLGVSVRADEIKSLVKRALKSPAGQAGVKRLRLGIRSQDADAWIPLPLWDSGRREINWDRFKGAACGAGLDLASSCDFASLSLCFPVDADLSPAAEFKKPWGYLFRWHFWLPEGWQNTQQEALRRIARPWSPDWVRFTEGDVIDQDVIESSVIELASEFDLRALCFDPWNATQLSTHLDAEGIVMINFPQKMARYASPCKKYGESLMGNRFIHDGNPCARWMADNVVTVQNGAEQMMPHRKKSKNKIDGIVASVMALDAALQAEPNPGKYYETNEVEFA